VVNLRVPNEADLAISFTALRRWEPGMKPNRTLRIFLVDDDPFFLQLYAQYLNNLGYTDVYSFDKGADCLGELGLKPDLVVLDYHMEGMNGIEILKKIKGADADIVVVFVSGQEEIDIAVNSLQYGAFDYITKESFHSEKIKTCLGKVGQIREILVKRKKLGNIEKVISSVGAFSFFLFFQRVFSRL
jgi:DNA-binding NtrC family response regulator